MTFCSNCGREYDPYKSEASQPKRYCSQQCEDEDEDKADKKYFFLADNNKFLTFAA